MDKSRILVGKSAAIEKRPKPDDIFLNSAASLKIRRRRPLHKPLPIRNTDIYIRSRSSIKALEKRALKLLFPSFEKQGRYSVSVKDLVNSLQRRTKPMKAHDNNETLFVDIHAMGACIPKAILLAGILTEDHPQLEISETKTESCVVEDEIELLDSFDIRSEERIKSTIHIRIANKSSKS